MLDFFIFIRYNKFNKRTEKKKNTRGKEGTDHQQRKDLPQNDNGRKEGTDHRKRNRIRF